MSIYLLFCSLILSTEKFENTKFMLLRIDMGRDNPKEMENEILKK